MKGKGSALSRKLRAARARVRHYEQNIARAKDAARRAVVEHRYGRACALLAAQKLGGPSLQEDARDHRPVYHDVAVVRVNQGIYTIGMDLYGGTEHLRGSWASAESAIAAAASVARRVLCVAPGENAGETYRDLYDEAGPVLVQSEKFLALAGGIAERQFPRA